VLAEAGIDAVSYPTVNRRLPVFAKGRLASGFGGGVGPAETDIGHRHTPVDHRNSPAAGPGYPLYGPRIA
jgi:hypothetical protein